MKSVRLIDKRCVSCLANFTVVSRMLVVCSMLLIGSLGARATNSPAENSGNQPINNPLGDITKIDPGAIKSAVDTINGSKKKDSTITSVDEKARKGFSSFLDEKFFTTAAKELASSDDGLLHLIALWAEDPHNNTYFTVSGQARLATFLDSPTTANRESLAPLLQLLNNPASISERASIPELARTYQLYLNAPQIESSDKAQITSRESIDWQSRAIYGLTDFIVNRAYNELLITFLDVLQKNLTTESTLKILFPATYDFLGLGTQPGKAFDASNLFPITASFRAVLHNDLQKLPYSLVKISESDDSALVHASVTLLEDLKNGEKPIYAIANLVNALLEGSNSNSKLKEMSNIALFSINAYKTYLDPGLKKLVACESVHNDVKKLLLLYFNVGRVDICNQLKESNKLNDAWKMMQDVFAIVRRAEVYRNTLVSGRSADSTQNNSVSASFSTYIDFYRGALIRAGQFLASNDSTVLKSLNKADTIMMKLTETYASILGGQYQSAILNAISVLKLIKPDSSSQLAIYQYLNMAATVVSAKSSKEVNDAIQAVALPVEGFRAKHSSHWWFGVTAYAGLGYSSEKIDGSGVTGPEKRMPEIGAAVPVGVELIFARPKLPVFRQFGLLLGIIDLGAVASYRIEATPTSENNPNVSWEQVLAPSLYLTTSFGAGLPFSAGVGAEFAPKLRNFTDSGGLVAQKSVFRFPAVFLAVDVPIFGFGNTKATNQLRADCAKK